MSFKTDKVKPSNATSTKTVAAWKRDTSKQHKRMSVRVGRTDRDCGHRLPSLTQSHRPR
jgi:hypothetical protein